MAQRTDLSSSSIAGSATAGHGSVHLRIALPALLTVVLFVGAMLLVFFPRLEDNFLEQRKETAMRLVQTATYVLAGFDQEVRAGNLSLEDAQRMALGFLHDMRYGEQEKDYFWVNDLTPAMLMHPYRSDLNGQDLSDYADLNGKKLFVEMVQVVQAQGEGMVEYLWQWKDDPNRVVPKISFVKLFKPWGWILGTGVYLDDVHAQFAGLRATLIQVSVGILVVVLLLAGYMILHARRADRERAVLLGRITTEQRRYQSLVDNLTTGVALINKDHDILALNEQMRRWFPSVDLSANPVCFKEFNQESRDHSCLPCPLEETFADGQVHEKTVVRDVADGKRTFRVVTSPVLDDQGRVANVIEMFEDITERMEAERQVRRAEKRYRSLFENAVEGIFQSTPEGRFLDANPALARIYGYDSPAQLLEEVEDIGAQFFVHPERREEFKLLLEENGEVTDFVSQIYRRDGEIIWVSENTRAARTQDGRILHYEGTIEDITERKRAEADLAEQKAFFQELFEGSPLAIAMVNAEGVLLDVNPSFESYFGYRSEEIIGKRNRDVVVPEKYIGEAEAFRKTILKGNPVAKETERKSASGELLPVEVVASPIRHDSVVVGAYYIYRDISERKEFEKQLSHQAFHDSLTALPNRSLYMERLRHALERSRRREDYHFAVLMVDLDRFKRINDTLGHHVGDQLLIGIALRILSCIRTVDTVARLGGDEFAILLEEFESPREVIRVSNRIRDMFKEPFTIEGNKVHTGASIGIVLQGRGYDTAEDVLRDADIAMYKAKEQGKARLVFNKRMHDQAVEVGRMETELRTALETRQFTLYYQPIVNVDDKSVQGFEALVRWLHPQRGVVGPVEFIPLAEETGLIVPLGRWIIYEACRQMAEWIENGKATTDMSISINLSAKQFMQTDLVDYIQSVVERTGLPPTCLKLEVTESVIMQDAPVTSAKLARLKNFGVKIMIDDFGTGYSSLSYLQQFPVDFLKIDRSFISGGGDEEEKMEIVKTIIALARNLGLGVVAEGVEKEEQYDRLKAIRCETAQGFMFSRPMDSQAVDKLLDDMLAKRVEVKVAGSDATEPDATEPDAGEPDATEPDAGEPSE